MRWSALVSGKVASYLNAVLPLCPIEPEQHLLAAAHHAGEAVKVIGVDHGSTSRGVCGVTSCASTGCFGVVRRQPLNSSAPGAIGSVTAS